MGSMFFREEQTNINHHTDDIENQLNNNDLCLQEAIYIDQISTNLLVDNKIIIQEKKGECNTSIDTGTYNKKLTDNKDTRYEEKKEGSLDKKITSINTLEYMFVENNYFPYHESETVEFKKGTLNCDKMSVAISGFSNHHGGTIFFGILDNRKINGIKLTDKQIDSFKLNIDNIQHTCVYPPISDIKVIFNQLYTNTMKVKQDHYVVSVVIPKKDITICSQDGNSYKRYNASFRTCGLKLYINMLEHNKMKEDLEKKHNDVVKIYANMLEHCIKKIK